MRSSRYRILFALLMLALATPAGAGSEPPILTGLEAEAFLRSADIVDMRPLETGVTHSHRATLTNGTTTVRAVWKTIDEYQPFKRFYDGAPPELGFIDSYKNEIAAYELDKILGLDMVPPTVERRIGRKRGSLQLWIEGAITEGERFKSKKSPPDTEAWLRQVFAVRAFRQLIYDADYQNASNLLCDEDFRVWSVDHSRAFRIHPELLDEKMLKRFPAPLLERLRLLDADLLKEKLSPWLSKGQREALLARRDLILAHAESRIAREGEDAVLLP